eukprot:scaffold106490_cov38-Prasinocladus_malaysianus.AAC.2
MPSVMTSAPTAASRALRFLVWRLQTRKPRRRLCRLFVRNRAGKLGGQDARRVFFSFFFLYAGTSNGFVAAGSGPQMRVEVTVSPGFARRGRNQKARLGPP